MRAIGREHYQHRTIGRQCGSGSGYVRTCSLDVPSALLPTPWTGSLLELPSFPPGLAIVAVEMHITALKNQHKSARKAETWCITHGGWPVVQGGFKRSVVGMLSPLAMHSYSVRRT